MGAALSSIPGKVEQSDPSIIVIDQTVRDQISELGSLIKKYNENDTKALLQTVKDFKGAPNMSNIESHVEKFHNELLNAISVMNPGMGTEEKDRRLQGVLTTRAELPAHLKGAYDIKFKEFKNKLMNDSAIAKDKNVQKDLGLVFDNIIDLKTKYKFFEYRYIQMNLFMIAFTQHAFSTVDQFVNVVIEYTRQRDTASGELIKMLLKIMKEAEMTIQDNDFAAIDKLMKDMETEIADKKLKMDTAAEKAKQNILTFAGDGEGFTPATVSTSSQTGGFIRSQSVIPQSFYKL